MKLPSIPLRLALAGAGLLVAVPSAVVIKLKLSSSIASGMLKVPGVTSETAISRDNGRLHIQAYTLAEACYALGFAQAQDRFYEMDLLRRAATGETAELLGKGGLEKDKLARLHGFQARAATYIQTLDTTQRALLEAYAEGANEGLTALHTRPWQYQVLGSEPRPWKPEDSLLVAWGWYLAQQHSLWDSEIAQAAVRDNLGTPFFQLFTKDNAAIPGPKVLNLRKDDGVTAAFSPEELNDLTKTFLKRWDRSAATAVTCTTKPDGALAQGVSGLNWYPVSFWLPSGKMEALTLPGLPLPLAGTTATISWGLRSDLVDTADTTLLSRPDKDEMIYTSNGKVKALTEEAAAFAVRGEKAVTVPMLTSEQGPVVGRGHRRQHLALQWVAYAPGAVDFRLWTFATAGTAAEAAAVGAGAGIPNATLEIIDAKGTRAESHTGLTPVRTGYDGTLPVSWSYGDRGWERVVPSEGTAKAAAGIEESVSGENEARWVRWFEKARANAGSKAKDAKLETFRAFAIARVLGPLFEALLEEPAFQPRGLDLDRATLALLDAKPKHLLLTNYESWDDLLAKAVVDAAERPDWAALPSTAPGGFRGTLYSWLAPREQPYLVEIPKPGTGALRLVEGGPLWSHLTRDRTSADGSLKLIPRGPHAGER